MSCLNFSCPMESLTRKNDALNTKYALHKINQTL